MEIYNKLTILLPLKNRKAFTLRYFLYLEAIKCPFPILALDGSASDEIEETIKKHKHKFPNVKFRYIRFPEDKSIFDFIKKMHEGYKIIETPYVMWNADDDFPLVNGLLESLTFLEKNPDYVCCGGQYIAFCTKENQAFNRINYFSHVTNSYARMDFSQNDPLKRILAQMPYNGSFAVHAVVKREIFKEIFGDIIKANITSLKVAEYYMVRALLTFGKIAAPYYPFYVYQRLSGASSETDKSIMYECLNGTYVQNHQAHISLLAQKLHKQTKYTEDELAVLLNDNFINSLETPKTLSDSIVNLGMQDSYLTKRLRRIKRKIEKFYLSWLMAKMQKIVLFLKFSIKQKKLCFEIYKDLSLIEKFIDSNLNLSNR